MQEADDHIAALRQALRQHYADALISLLRLSRSFRQPASDPQPPRRRRLPLGANRSQPEAD
jgi:hypothetical protein